MSASKVRWAVVPAAGLGTRMLPATKAIPKEMLTVADAPLIEHVVREAAAAGIADVVIITAEGKDALRAHFERAPALDAALRARGKAAQADELVGLERLARLHWVIQEEPRGLGHAVLCARATVNGNGGGAGGGRSGGGKGGSGSDTEPFAVLLPDELFITAPGTPSATAQLCEVFERTGGGGAIATAEVPAEEVSRYGILDARRDAAGVWRVSDLVEKPAPDRAPSHLAVIGRYVLPGRTFAALARTAPGHGGEIQLTDALRVLAREGGVVAAEVRARRIDAGNTVGWLLANAELALQNPLLRAPFAAGLRALLRGAGEA
jgi:UTP--glucose-1-phosphate uridylyltransferase